MALVHQKNIMSGKHVELGKFHQGMPIKNSLLIRNKGLFLIPNPFLFDMKK